MGINDGFLVGISDAFVGLKDGFTEGLLGCNVGTSEGTIDGETVDSTVGARLVLTNRLKKAESLKHPPIGVFSPSSLSPEQLVDGE